MDIQIQGELAQVARLILSKNEKCWCSKGSLMRYTPGVDWQLRMPGGVSGSVRRMLSGEGLALTHVHSNQDGQDILLSSNQTGKLYQWDLSQGAVYTTRGAFVAAYGPDIHIDVEIAKRTGAAIFGGAGLFLQKISGTGTVLVHGSGDFIDSMLESGEQILVSTGNLAAFSESVDYSIQNLSGVRRILFGGEGLFMTKLTGPGRVLLQSIKRQRHDKSSREG